MLPTDTFQPRPGPAASQPKKRIIRRPFIILAIPLVLGGVFYLVENWRGPRIFRERWEKMAAQGEKLHINQFTAAAVPAEQNFMMSPAWGDSLKSRDPWRMEFPVMLPAPRNGERDWDTMQRDWDTVQFAEWAPWEQQISALAAAAETMPHSVFPVPPGEEIAIGFARAMCEFLMLRAKAAQREGNTKAFIQGLRICLRLHEALQARPELYNQLAAFAIADHILFALEPQTPWSREESELLARGLKHMDRLPDFALSLEYDQAHALDMSIYKDGCLMSISKGSWLPQGWSGLAFSWWLDLQQFRIDSARLWPAKSKLPDPRVDGPRTWQGFAAVVISSDDDIARARNEALKVRIRVALARLEHAFGWYRREHGRDIEKPEDLLPFLDGAWPINPYTGNPHIIEPDEDRWCIRWNPLGLPPGLKDVWRFPSRSKLTP